MKKLSDKTAHILAVSMGGVGDTVLFSPVLRAVRRKYPDAIIELLTVSRLCHDLYSGCREIDKITIVDIEGKSLFSKIMEFKSYAARARRDGGCDIAVFATGLNAGWSSFLRYYVPIKRIYKAPVPPVFKTDLECNMALARQFDATITEEDVFVPLSSESRDEARDMLAQCGIDYDADKMVVIYPSLPTHGRIRWPVSCLIETARRLNSAGFKIIVAGSVSEGHEWHANGGDDFVDANMAGKLSIAGTAALLDKSVLVVGNDGGIMHVAGALGCVLVDIAINVSASYRPPGGRTIVINSTQSSVSGGYVDITVDEVVDACSGIINSRIASDS